ncbi:hypothetical protein PIB30_094862, partial [Stylosanthes scabra]|nr:hypothetical protein [Stylosanthes scabra]
MRSFARRPGVTISGGLLSLTTGTASGTIVGSASIRFRSCPPTTPVGQPRNMLIGGWLPVIVGSCPRIACCKILEALSCRMID